MAIPRRRSRTIPTSSTLIELGYFQSRDPVTGTILPSHYDAQTHRMSTNHAYRRGEFCRDELHGSPPYKTGGDFFNVRVDSCEPFSAVNGKGTYFRPDGRIVYTGGFRPPGDTDFDFNVTTNLGPLMWNSVSENHWLFPSLDGLGTRAYNASKPHLEKSKLGVFVAELRDLPGMLKTTSKLFHDEWKKTQAVYIRGNLGGYHGGTPDWVMTPRKAADNFLNHEFGWRPFLGDMSKFYETISRTSEHLARLKRQNGQWVKRRVPLVDETSSLIVKSGTGVKLFPNSVFDYDPRSNYSGSWFSQPATWSVHEITFKNVTAVGRFRFWRPEFDERAPDYFGVIKTLQRRATILGARISPSMIYKATPWTWAGDWVSNAGDFVERVNDYEVDSVVSKYVYVMQHQIKIRRFVQNLPFNTGTVTLSFDRVIDTKQRKGASGPYQFDLSWDSLTPRQYAIAGALGITRQRGIV